MRNHPAENSDIDALAARATRLRRHMLTMAKGQGQGYIGQGLGIADLIAQAEILDAMGDGGDPGAGTPGMSP